MCIFQMNFIFTFAQETKYLPSHAFKKYFTAARFVSFLACESNQYLKAIYIRSTSCIELNSSVSDFHSGKFMRNVAKLIAQPLMTSKVMETLA